MNLRAFIFIASIVLLTIGLEMHSSEKKIEKKRSFILEFYGMEKSPASLIYSYLTGRKSSLNKTMIRRHKRLGILHLLTPSGLHLHSFFLIITLLFKNSKIHTRKLKILSFFAITISLIYYPQNHAIRRIFIFQSLSFCLQKISTRNIFFFTFIIDFIIGGFSSSPLSYALSFLFLGIFLSSNKITKAPPYFSLFLGQVLVAIFFSQKIYPLSVFLGFFLTWIFIALFPFVAFFSLAPSRIPLSIVNYFMKIFIELLVFFDRLGFHIGGFFPTKIDVILILLLLINKKQIPRFTRPLAFLFWGILRT